MTYVIDTPAKLNLTLDVVGKREDGYHLMNMVMQTVSIFDRLEVTRAQNLSVRCHNIDLNIDVDSNIITRAAKAFFEATGIDGGADILLHKYIPMGAGLGGGSADGAATLHALNRIYETNLSVRRLAEIGLTVGADIPFCVYGGTARVEGVGERVSPIKPLMPCDIVVVKPQTSINTQEAFAQLDESEHSMQVTTPDMVSALERGSLIAVAAHLSNAFLTALPESYLTESVKPIEALRKNGALNATMTGSGSAVFGLFGTHKAAVHAADVLCEAFPSAQVFHCAPLCGYIC